MLALVTAGILNSLVTQLGYLAIFVLVGVESVGIPLPGETALIAAAIYAGSTHKLSIAAVIGTAAAAAIIGDNIGYSVGRRGGLPFLRRYLHVGEARIKLGRYLFMTYGAKVVFVGRFVAILRTYAAFLAGTMRMPRRRFFAFNAGGAIVWATAYGLAAYYGQGAFKSLSAPLDIVLLLVALGAIARAVVYVRRNLARLTTEADRALPDVAGS